jgi:hypothetical protein
MSEDDFEMGGEAGPSVVDVSPVAKSSPLTFDLAAASLRLFTDIGIVDLEQAKRSGLPESLVQAAFSDDPSIVQPDQLLPAISHLASQSGMQDLITRHFGPIMLQIIAPWLQELNTLAAEVWESRLYFVASLAAVRPDMWRYVDAGSK